MQAHCGVFRFPDMLVEGVSRIEALGERVGSTEIADKSRTFNTARVEALELDNLIEVARATMVSAEARRESRGAHDRADYHDRPGYPNGRDDKDWLKHTLWFKEGDRLEYKPVNLKPLTIESIPPKARAY
jgi:succinate dehydrogenase / fumarate reductase, flavoprotein subunit